MPDAGREGVCSAVSPESRRPCVLADTREAHLAGHETATVEGVRCGWATTDAERMRWSVPYGFDLLRTPTGTDETPVTGGLDETIPVVDAPAEADHA